jgi:hypothetical protein
VVGGCIKYFDFCLRVSERGGSTGSTQGRVSQRFLGGRGVPSSESRASWNVVDAFCSSFWLIPSLWAELLVWFFQGFFSLIINCGYPLFWYPTVAPEPLGECGSLSQRFNES